MIGFVFSNLEIEVQIYYCVLNLELSLSVDIVIENLRGVFSDKVVWYWFTWCEIREKSSQICWRHLLECTDHLERFIALFIVGITYVMLWIPMDSK